MAFYELKVRELNVFFSQLYMHRNCKISAKANAMDRNREKSGIEYRICTVGEWGIYIWEREWSRVGGHWSSKFYTIIFSPLFEKVKLFQMHIEILQNPDQLYGIFLKNVWVINMVCMKQFNHPLRLGRRIIHGQESWIGRDITWSDIINIVTYLMQFWINWQYMIL